jgi:2-aminoadipate transaminase
MRLNFSGVADEEIREGIKRIGRVIREQVELYEALAPGQSAQPVEPSRGTPGRGAEDVPVDGPAGNVVPLRKEANG